MINIEKIKIMIFYMIELGNRWSGQLIILGLMYLICIFFQIYEDKGKRENFIWVIKRRCRNQVLSIVVILFFAHFLQMAMSFNLFRVINLKKYWLLWSFISLLLAYRSGKRSYDWLQFTDSVDKIEEDRLTYTTPEIEFTRIIRRYDATYDLKKEKLNLLKAISPISLMPVILGQYMADTNVKINWDIFFLCLCCLFVGYMGWIVNTYKELRKINQFRVYVEDRREKCKI